MEPGTDTRTWGRALALTIMLAAFVLTLFLVSVAAQPADGRALVSVSPAGRSAESRLKADGLAIYGSLARDGQRSLLVRAAPHKVKALRREGYDVAVLDPDSAGASYYLAYRLPNRPEPEWGEFGQLLLDDGRHLVLRIDESGTERLVEARALFHPLALDAGRATDTPATVWPPLNQPSPAVQAMIDAVSSTVVYAYTGDLSGEWPVLVGGAPYTISTRNTYYGNSEGVKKATELVGERLEALGLGVEYHEWESDLYPNVIGQITGSVDPGEIYILGAHIDDMPAGPVAPGADDNTSGSVGVLVAAEILSRYEWECTLRFALWTGEEQGLRGSRAYAQRSTSLGEVISGVLNLDMIGWNTPGSSRDIDLHARESVTGSLSLATVFSDVVNTYDLDLVPQIIPDGIPNSDHGAFWIEGYPAILAIEDVSDFNPNYHSTDDQLQNLDMGYYVEFVKAAVASFVNMSGCLARERVYFPMVAR
ncbi:M28 family metallopeptidase [Chloroflexota bacterium]